MNGTIVGIICAYMKGLSYTFLSHIIKRKFEIFLLKKFKINQSFKSPLPFFPTRILMQNFRPKEKKLIKVMFICDDSQPTKL